MLSKANKYSHVMLGDIRRAGLFASSLIILGMGVKVGFFSKR